LSCDSKMVAGHASCDAMGRRAPGRGVAAGRPAVFQAGAQLPSRCPRAQCHMANQFNRASATRLPALTTLCCTCRATAPHAISRTGPRRSCQHGPCLHARAVASGAMIRRSRMSNAACDPSATQQPRVRAGHGRRHAADNNEDRGRGAAKAARRAAPADSVVSFAHSAPDDKPRAVARRGPSSWRRTTCPLAAVTAPAAPRCHVVTGP
jgi:hypothetical protein